jgi:hypothetical protein
MDAPYRIIGDKKWHLQGHYNAPEQSIYLEQNQDVVLLVYKKYSCKADAARFQWQGNIQMNRPIDAAANTVPTSSRESLLLNSEILREALNLASADSDTPGAIDDFRLREENDAPYHYFYHDCAVILQKTCHMDEEYQAQIRLLMTYVKSSFEASYEEAHALFSQGLVSYETIPYLFKPKTYVVAEEDGELLGYEAICWLEFNTDSDWILRCWSWKFDGLLRESSKNFQIGWPWMKKELIPIQSLPVYPLEYGKTDLEEELQTRGQNFWSCKNRTYVSYDDETVFGDPVQVSKH